MRLREWRYIGDGVYTMFDGYGIWLHANSHDNPTDRIYLESKVQTALIAFISEPIAKKDEE